MDLRREIDQVLVTPALEVERCGLGRKRLGRRGALTRHRGSRHRTFLDRPHRFSGEAVENVGEGLFGYLRNRLDAFAIDGDVDQIGRGRRIVVPETVMNELIVPNFLSCRSIKANQALAKEAVTEPVAAKIVVGRRAHRQIDIAEFLVGAHRRPNIGVTGFLPRIVFPALDTGLALLWHGMESPEQTSGDDIEAPHVAWWRRSRTPPVEDRRADHDYPAHDHRRRTRRVVVGVDRPAQTLREIDPAIGPETWQQFSRFRIQRDHLRERGQDYNTLVITVPPIRDTAIDPSDIGRNAKTVFVDFWIEHPFGHP